MRSSDETDRCAPIVSGDGRRARPICARSLLHLLIYYSSSRKKLVMMDVICGYICGYRELYVRDDLRK